MPEVTGTRLMVWASQITDSKHSGNMKHEPMRLVEFIRLAGSMVLKVSQKNKNFETKLSLPFM